MSDHPRGILRNKSDNEESDEQLQHHLDHLDRQEVIKNTRLNAQLRANSTRGDEIRAKIAQKKKEHQDHDHDHDHESSPSHEHLKWDEVNIYKNEQEKSAKMKIDEPKTPYEGGFNPEGEYYRDDDDDENATANVQVVDEQDIPEFELGEGEYDKAPHHVSASLHGGQVIKEQNSTDNVDDEEEVEETPLSAEERHKRFEEKRKEHYHLKALPLKQNMAIPDDDDNNEEQEEEKEEEK
ncbi:hypothetical protein KGF56_004395 [Candida oxycetoniae]|uniref:Protein GLC8 n=1 Tax=Candida oxycetoniae TaxID=497107 RepID=A0AAI9WW19_9ASCO|nr:uncharacterized protein KGF56_004395 [Candida oxycetoniae]KAI3402721.2 hypothetical protein KGF56_004395 [Candida oxycetoniae]